MKDPCLTPFRQDLTAQDSFTLTFELVPSRGGRSTSFDRALDFARKAAADGRIQAVSITENAGGHPALSPEVMGLEIRKTGLEVIIHLSCKDKNRNQLESLLFAWDRHQLNNLLVITGDYPQQGYRGHAKPVFDLDSVQTLNLISRLNCEEGQDRRNPAMKNVQPTSFCKGVAVSPFKTSEAELLMQYGKLHRKINAGAQFIITQVGYDARKFHELIQYMKQHELNLPLLGNVFIPSPRVAQLMIDGTIPGIIIPPILRDQWLMELKKPDRGRRDALSRGAGLLAILKGLGYAGAHIGGPGIKFEELDFILTEAERMSTQWQERLTDFKSWPDDAFFYYEKDPDSELNTPQPSPRTSGSAMKSFQFADWFHRVFFSPKGTLYNPTRRVALYLDDSSWANTVATLEHLIKLPLFGCRNCGDCTLAELGYRCPQQGCAKYLLNGPCGGSRDGWCEVYPGKKKCFYLTVYDQFVRTGKGTEITKGFIPPRDWSLNKTSSWLNFFANRDHHNNLK
ncbi:MAG: methylenetetrahydrofolate reductase C-terminal domain-containing protein [Proteobacteria bacterium]|nr:methylenetetrahydrofolate reductase C-terminal domain-containing protein [Pseudomonadota bacterium]MBU1686405.1 methylenetetrahydrofolate reductase C-terminal domain-containing protein [Pseudomonadota bacterium]